MNKVYEEGVLIVTNSKGGVLKLSVHPSTREPWKSEEEALSFSVSPNYPFKYTQQVTEVSAFNFKLLFSPVERIAIKNSTDELVMDFYEMLNDPRLEVVELGHTDTVEAVNYLATLGLIEPVRTEQILSGQPR